MSQVKSKRIGITMPIAALKDYELEPSDELVRAVVLTTVMLLALALIQQHHDVKSFVGLRDLQVKALYRNIKGIVDSVINSSRSLVMSEIRKLLRVGPARYYRDALTELRKEG